MITKPFSRRDFLKVLGASSGTLAGAWLLAGCAPSSEASPPPNPSPTVEASPTTAATATPGMTASPSQTTRINPTATPAPATEFLPSFSEANRIIPLPAPRLEGGTSLMQALLGRHSTRLFLPDELPMALLGDLLWAAFGVNRPQSGKRTAPSAYDVRDIDIYLAAQQGLFRYQAESHNLAALLPDDLRSFTGTQAYVAAAPLNLVYVSDYRRMTGSAAEREQWSWAHSGFIAQNVYLYCAAAGLACVVRSTIERDGLARRMDLDKTQHVILAQTLGYPAG
jgi:nitroreductase